MKSAYFVRHGSTTAIEKKAYQADNESLSERGKLQAAALAARFDHTIMIDTILSSDMTRALDTAQIIADRTGHAVESEPLFREIARPSEVRGKSGSHPDVIKVMAIVRKCWADSSERHSNEENFFDLRERAQAALSYLVCRPEERILVVTHGMLLRMLFCCMMAGDGFGPDLFALVNTFLSVSNTGVTHCEHKDGIWRLSTWNDHVHL